MHRTQYFVKIEPQTKVFCQILWKERCFATYFKNKGHLAIFLETKNKKENEFFYM